MDDNLRDKVENYTQKAGVTVNFGVLNLLYTLRKTELTGTE